MICDECKKLWTKPGCYCDEFCEKEYVDPNGTSCKYFIKTKDKDMHPALFMLIVVIMVFLFLAVLHWGGNLYD